MGFSPLLNVASLLYRAGLCADRHLTRARRLPQPVLSVGNVSSGGRGKTPFTILLANWLEERGRMPVVLTRGYGRETEEALTLRSRRSPAPANGVPSASRAGDEPLEIWAATGAHVLIGADRAANALAFARELSPSDFSRTVFLLDDGFQHWRLERDFDLVLLDPRDRRDHLLPRGRLREPLEALERADLVLTRGADFDKVADLRSKPGAGTKVAFVTTRAPDAEYAEAILAQYPAAAPVQLQDHAGAPALHAALATNPARELLVGAKEAVKLLAPAQLPKFFETGRAENVAVGSSPRTLHYVACRLEVRQPHFWPTLERWVDSLD